MWNMVVKYLKTHNVINKHFNVGVNTENNHILEE